MRFEPLRETQAVLGWGMQPFNGTLANNISVLSNQILQGLFLTDPSRAADITPTTELAVPCSNTPGHISTTKCQRSYLLPYGVGYSAMQFNGPTQSDIVVANDQQSYILNFEEGDPTWVFNDTTECQSYGFVFAAFRLCLKNIAQSSIQAS